MPEGVGGLITEYFGGGDDQCGIGELDLFEYKEDSLECADIKFILGSLILTENR